MKKILIILFTFFNISLINAQRSFYNINKVCDLDYDRQNKVVNCYDVNNVSITRDYSNKYFVFFSNNNKTTIPFSNYYDDGQSIGYYFQDMLVVIIKLKDNTRIPETITLVNESNNIGRRFYIKDWSKE